MSDRYGLCQSAGFVTDVAELLFGYYQRAAALVALLVGYCGERMAGDAA